MLGFMQRSLLLPEGSILTFSGIAAAARERDLTSVHAANRAGGTPWNVHVRVSSILSRSCNKQEATSFWHE